MTRVLEGARYSFEPAKGELEEPAFLKAAKREKKQSAALTVLIVCKKFESRSDQVESDVVLFWEKESASSPKNLFFPRDYTPRQLIVVDITIS